MPTAQPDLSRASTILTVHAMAEIRKQPFKLQGWKVLERWAANSPQKLAELEQTGTINLLTRLLAQQTVETAALELTQQTHLSSMDLLAEAGISTEL